MKISEIQIVPVKPQDGLIGFASCVLDNCYFIGSIAIYTRLDGGHRLVYPSKKLGERNMHFHHPINHEANKAIEDAVLERVRSIFST